MHHVLLKMAVGYISCDAFDHYHIVSEIMYVYAIFSVQSFFII